eukprot:gene23194-28070_t
MEDWLASFQDEAFNSNTLYLESKLSEGLRVTEHLGAPNRLRTAICCHIFDLIVDNMSKYFQPTMEILKRELYGSIYHDPNGLLSEANMGSDLMGAGGRTPSHLYLESRPFYLYIDNLREELSQKNDLIDNLQEDRQKKADAADMTM